MISDQARNGASADGPVGGALAGARGGPTAGRIALGVQLRRLREASHVTGEEAGEAIRATRSKISRLERGRCRAKQRDLADLLTLYGVTDEAEREALLTLARQANAPGWWQQYIGVLPKWFELYIGLEQAASMIRAYEVQFVHGLMQTEDYARAVILTANAHAPVAEIDRHVSIRMRRQQLLTRPGAPRLWAVLDESALRRPWGGPAVMRAQLEHAAGHRTAQRHAPDRSVPRWPARRSRRLLHHLAVPPTGPARSGLPRAAPQRALPRPARRRHRLPDRHGPARRPGRNRCRQPGHASRAPQTGLGLACPPGRGGDHGAQRGLWLPAIDAHPLDRTPRKPRRSRPESRHLVAAGSGRAASARSIQDGAIRGPRLARENEPAGYHLEVRGGVRQRHTRVRRPG